LEGAIKALNKQQREERGLLAERVMKSKMNATQKMAVKRQLEDLARRCARLQQLFQEHQAFKRFVKYHPVVFI
jgi:hypothetical protein